MNDVNNALINNRNKYHKPRQNAGTDATCGHTATSEQARRNPASSSTSNFSPLQGMVLSNSS